MSDPAVLFVDDHPETTKLASHHLEAVGKARFAHAPEEALEIVAERTGPFDLLILDIHLPGDVSGTELLAAIRKRPGYDRVPALACTAQAMPGDREALLAASFDAYLPKPFVHKECLGKVRAPLASG